MKRTNTISFLWIAGLMALMVPRLVIAAAISGDVSFWGDSDGVHPLEIAAHTAFDEPPVSATDVSSPGGAYNLTVNDGSYYISAFLDRDESGGPPDPYEPLVWYDANGDGLPDMVTVSGGDVPGIDVDLGFVYVDIDANDTNDGSSWTNAFVYLNDAIQAAVSGIEVWVAQGTYVPPGIDRRNRFVLKNGVRIYGGFAGNETTRAGRNPSTFQTTLSGEIGNPGTDDNVYHVVWASNTNLTPLLDGFTITGGRADGLGAPWNEGGGLYAYFGGATVVNVTFSGNYASQAGGGMATNGGVVHVYNSRFFGNQAGVYPAGWGGGFYGKTNGEILVNCVFSGNLAGQRGGAIYMESGSFGGTLTGLSIHGNTTGWEAGGLFINNNGATDTYLSNSIVWGNNAEQVLTWGPVQVSYSLVQGGLAGGTNISTADPLFIDVDGLDDLPGTPDDNLGLQGASPAIDAGNNALVPLDTADLDDDFDTTEVLPMDIDFNTRFVDIPAITDTGNGSAPVIDLGAYEVVPNPVIFKDSFE